MVVIQILYLMLDFGTYSRTVTPARGLGPRGRGPLLAGPPFIRICMAVRRQWIPAYAGMMSEKKSPFGDFLEVIAESDFIYVDSVVRTFYVPAVVVVIDLSVILQVQRDFVIDRKRHARNAQSPE